MQGSYNNFRDCVDFFWLFFLENINTSRVSFSVAELRVLKQSILERAKPPGRP